MKGCMTEREELWKITYRSTRFGPLGSQLQLNCKFSDELSEEVLVGVLGELIENKPVSNLTFGEDVLQTFSNILVIFVSDLYRII